MSPKRKNFWASGAGQCCGTASPQPRKSVPRPWPRCAGSVIRTGALASKPIILFGDYAGATADSIPSQRVWVILGVALARSGVVYVWCDDHLLCSVDGSCGFLLSCAVLPDLPDLDNNANDGKHRTNRGFLYSWRV